MKRLMGEDTAAAVSLPAVKCEVTNMDSKTSILFPVIRKGNKPKKSRSSDFKDEWLDDTDDSGGRPLRDEYLDSDNETDRKKDKKRKPLTSNLGKEWLGLPDEDDGRSLRNEYLGVSSDRSKEEKPVRLADYLGVEEPLLGLPPPKKPAERDADRAYAIALDFLNHEIIAVVGKSLHRYNGVVYERLAVDEAEALLFNAYHRQLNVPNKLSIVKNAASYLKFMVKQKLDEFPFNSDIIVFPNGTLEINKGDFRKNSPNDLACFALAIDYDPNQWDMQRTERYLRTLSNRDNELYERMLQTIGYILTPDIDAKAFFYLQGPPHSGKSRFYDLISMFFPAVNIDILPIQNFGDRFALGGLVNKKLVIADDLPGTVIPPVAVSRVKTITGSSRIDGEEKYKTRGPIKHQCKVMFTSNWPARLKEDDEAFRERMVYIPCDNVLPKEKWIPAHVLLQQMKPELPALFNHAFEAYKRLRKSNYTWAGSDRFIPEIVITSEGVSPDRAQVINWFTIECCEFNEEVQVSVEDLQRAYVDYCHKHSYQPVAGDRFSREFLAVVGSEYPGKVERIKISNQQRGYRGIRLRMVKEDDKAVFTANL